MKSPREKHQRKTVPKCEQKPSNTGEAKYVKCAA